MEVIAGQATTKWWATKPTAPLWGNAPLRPSAGEPEGVGWSHFMIEVCESSGMDGNQPAKSAAGRTRKPRCQGSTTPPVPKIYLLVILAQTGI